MACPGTSSALAAPNSPAALTVHENLLLLQQENLLPQRSLSWPQQAAFRGVGEMKEGEFLAVAPPWQQGWEEREACGWLWVLSYRLDGTHFLHLLGLKGLPTFCPR